MCRLLLVKSSSPFDTAPHLRQFAYIAQHSKEYQGHGWGCGVLRNGEWQLYKTISPIWEDDVERFGSTTLLIAHARSAFQNQGIVVENNMPFFDGRYMFIFNGELRGVRLRMAGRTGAEKLFALIKKAQDSGDMAEAIRRTAELLQKRSRYIRAMNLIITDGSRAYVQTFFNEDSEYFTLRMKQEGPLLVVCSESYPDESGWRALTNRTVEVF